MNPISDISPIERRQGILAILAAAVLWSTGGVFIKLISLDAWGLCAFRALFAALAFFLIFRQEALRFNRLSLINALLYALCTFLFVMATKLTTAANAIFLQFTAPVYILVLEPWLFRIPLRRAHVVTLVFCMAGMALFFLDEAAPGHMTGNLLALLSGAVLAAFTLIQKLNTPTHQASAILGGNLVLSLACMPLALQGGFPSGPDWLMLAYLGTFQLGIAYGLFTFSLRRILAIETSLFGMIEPVLNPMWVFFFYGERPGNWAIAGGIVILVTLSLRSILNR